MKKFFWMCLLIMFIPVLVQADEKITHNTNRMGVSRGEAQVVKPVINYDDMGRMSIALCRVVENNFMKCRDAYYMSMAFFVIIEEGGVIEQSLVDALVEKAGEYCTTEQPVTMSISVMNQKVPNTKAEVKCAKR
jgi:hypothetical protein